MLILTRTERTQLEPKAHPPGKLIKCHISFPYHSMWYHKIFTRNKLTHLVSQAYLTRKMWSASCRPSSQSSLVISQNTYQECTTDSPAREKCHIRGVTAIFHCDLTKTHQEWAHTSCAPGGPLRGCWQSDTCRRPHCTLMVRSMSSSQGTSS